MKTLATIPIIMPQLGESIAEATIVNFLVKPGDNVEADQDLIEVETDKATMTVAGLQQKLDDAGLGDGFAKLGHDDGNVHTIKN